MSTITALAPWFGGKRTLAATILAEIGPHRSWWEPFCGSMAMLFAKDPVKSETVNDLHGDLINLARVVRSPTLGPKLYRRLRRTLCAEALFRESLTIIREQAPPRVDPDDTGGEARLDLDRAYHYFVASWLGMNGVAGTSVQNTSYAVRYSSSGGDPATRWQSAIRSIPAWRARMAGVVVLSKDGFEIIEKCEDRDGTVIYCDPPYLKKGAKYLHDFEEADHARLADLLARFTRTTVAVSYYAHPKLAELYPGWSIIPLAATKSITNQGKRDAGGATAAPEVLLLNRREPGRDPGGLLF